MEFFSQVFRSELISFAQANKLKTVESKDNEDDKPSLAEKDARSLMTLPEFFKIKTTVFSFLVQIFLVGAILSSVGCEPKPEKERESVTHQTFITHFTGYKVIYLLKAPPEEVELYLRDPRNLLIRSGIVELGYLSGERMEKLGDRAEFSLKVEFLGHLAPYKLLLVHQEPGKELWYLSEGEKGKGLNLLRFKFKELNNLTKVTLSFEKEDEKDPFLKSVTEAVNLSETMVKAADWGGARMQAHFDPSLSPEQIMEKGYRGELYHKFYQGHQLTVQIQASPERVYQYLTGPEVSALAESYQFDFPDCFFSPDLNPRLNQMELMGFRYEIELLPGQRKPEEGYHSCYLISKNNSFLSRAQILIRGKTELTELRVNYITEAPETISPEWIQLEILIKEIPKILEQILLQIKSDTEKSAKP